MIRKPLNEIEWSDIEALRDSGREEDDTIEFKGSFSGGSDFLAFNDKQKETAVDGVAKEAIAFLNGRGGDIIIGATECKNDHPRIESLTPVENVSSVADRLAQSLAAIIEPLQTVLNVKAVKKSSTDDEGIIVVRTLSSLRAPHRSKRTKDCFVRRGRESLPMPMDEIQDLTLSREVRRSGRFDLLSKQFEGIAEGQLPLRKLPSPRFHARLVFVPFTDGQINLTTEILTAVSGDDPTLVNGPHTLRNDVAFRGLPDQWRPILRGRQKEMFAEASPDGESAFYFCRKSILANCLIAIDFSRYGNVIHGASQAGNIHVEWVIGYFANALFSLMRFFQIVPGFASGIVRVALVADGDLNLLVGKATPDIYPLPPYYSEIPDFELSENVTCNDIFEQLQKDIYSLAGIDPPIIWSLPEP